MLESDPFGHHKKDIKSEAINCLEAALDESEKITLTQEKDFYKNNHVGVYGGGFGQLATDLTRVNPQEKLDSSASILGRGRLLQDSFVESGMDGMLAYFSLSSNAEMQPYDDSLDSRPSAYYLRYGWKTDKKHMKPRPGFFERVARKGIGILARYSTKMLESVGFRRG